MPTFVEVLISPALAGSLRRLASGVPVSELRSLPLRTRQLIKRLEAAGHVVRRQRQGVKYVGLTDKAAKLVPPPQPRPAALGITRSQLDALGLPGVAPFEIHKAPPQMGRRSSPLPRIYLKRLPPPTFDPTRDLDDTALALLVFAPRATRGFIGAHPGRDWQRLRERIHDEDLAPRALYFGLNFKLIGLKKDRKTRSDAYRRAKTEPLPGQRRP